MKHGKAFLLFLLLLTSAVPAQQVIGTNGRNLNSSSGGLSFTLGEPAILTHQGTGITLSQGFHQPEKNCPQFKDGAEAEANPGITESYHIKAWPNPASEILNVETTGIMEPLVFKVIDAHGKSVLTTTSEGTGGMYRISLDGIPAQTLFLEVRTTANVRLQMIKVLKINQ